MLKNYWRVVSRIERGLDNVIFIACFFITYELRQSLKGSSFDGLLFPTLKVIAPIQSYLVILGFAIPLYNSVLSMLGAYRSMRLTRPIQLFRLAASASFIVFVLLAALLYIVRLDISRSFVAIYCLLCGIGVFTLRIIALTVLRFFRTRGKNFRNLLVVGTGEQAQSIAKEIALQPELGIRLAGFVSYEAPKIELVGEVVHGDSQPAVIASSNTFEAALKRNAIDEVLFTEVSENFSAVKQLANIAAEEGVGVSLIPDFFSLEILRSDVSYFGNLPLVHYRSTPTERPSIILKRVLDCVLAFFLIILFSPLMLFIALRVKLGSRGPVFFKQERVGLNGRTFTMLKFRSMYHGAERLRERMERKNQMQGPVFKVAEDPRVTKFGKFLRRSSLDELPQLFNVLVGDMSLVGPRPPLLSEVNLYERKQRRRLSMRPGMTCIWQVSGRNEIVNFDEWAKMDLEYIDNWSLGLDMRLLAKTVPAVLRGVGAR